MKHLVPITLFVLSAGVLLYELSLRSGGIASFPTIKAPEAPDEYVRYGAMGAALLVGILFGQLYNQINAYVGGNVDVDFVAELKKLFQRASLFQALLYAPMSFVLAVKTSEKASLPAAAYVAFQTGFFWKQVTNPKPAPPPDAPPKPNQGPAPGP